MSKKYTLTASHIVLDKSICTRKNDFMEVYNVGEITVFLSFDLN